MIDRSTYLGSHATSAILGRNPFVGKADIYCQALGIPDGKKPSQSMQMGLYFEEHILHWYEKNTGCKVSRQQEQVTHPKYPFIAGHVDGIVEGEPPHGVDAKLGSPFYMKEWGSEDNQIPEAYYLQCQHFMLCTGYPRWDIFLMCGTHLKNYPIDANPEIQKLVEDTLVTSWAEIEELRKIKAADATEFQNRMFAIAAEDQKAKENGDVYPA